MLHVDICIGTLAPVKIVDGVTIAVKDTKRRRSAVVLVRIPEDVDRLEGGAGHAAPVGLGVRHGGDSRTVVWARDRPAGLGNPDPFAGRYGVDLVAGSGNRVPESVVSIANGCVLEIGYDFLSN